jgi:hypothetical protein
MWAKYIVDKQDMNNFFRELLRYTTNGYSYLQYPIHGKTLLFIFGYLPILSLSSGLQIRNDKFLIILGYFPSNSTTNIRWT